MPKQRPPFFKWITTVSRPINGISLNGDVWLFSADKLHVLGFNNKEEAIAFMVSKGELLGKAKEANFHREQVGLNYPIQSV